MTASRGLGLRVLGVNTVRTLLANLATIGLGLGLSVLLARGLGPEANGIYALALLLPTTLATLMSLGLAPANAYYVGKGDLTARDALRASLWASAGLSVLGVALAAGVLELKGTEWFPGVPGGVMWLATASFPLTLTQSYLASLFQGLQDFRRYNGLILAAPLATFLLSAVFIIVLKTGVVGAVAAYGLGQVLTLGVAWYSLRPHLLRQPERSTAPHVWSQLKSLLSYGSRAHASNILAFANYRVDLFMVNLYLSPAAAGVYYVSVQMAERMWILSQVVGVVMLPRLSQLHTEEAKRLVLTPLVARFIFLATGLAAVGVAVVARPLIHVLFGEAFAEAQATLLLMLPGVVLGSVSRVVANDFAARGRPELNSYLSAVVLLVNVAANAILIPRYGINGAAVATTISYGINACCKFSLYQHLTGRPWWGLVVPQPGDWELIRQALHHVRARLKVFR